MRENEFYAVLDEIDRMVDEKENITEGWFPTVEEFKAYKVEKNLTKYYGILSYFAADPFKTLDNPDKDSEEYRETVNFCKKLLYNVNPEDLGNLNSL